MSKTMSYILMPEFEYVFDIGEVDSKYLSRVEAVVKERDGAVITSDGTCLTLEVSIAKLSENKLVSILSLSLLIKNLVTITVDSKNKASVIVRNPIRKYLYRSLFLIFSIVLFRVLASSQEYLQIAEAIPIVLFLYLIASRLTPMAEYARLKDFLFSQKDCEVLVMKEEHGGG